MKRLIVAAVAAGAFCALTANAQKLSATAVSPDEKVSSSQDWVFGTACDFDASDSSINFILGWNIAGDATWIQHYEVDAQEQCGCIGGVQLRMFRSVDNPDDMWVGREITAYLWSDPTNDLDPFDAVLLGEANFIVPEGRGPMFIDFPAAARVTGNFWVAGSIFANGTADGSGDPLAEWPASFNSFIELPDGEAWFLHNPENFDPNDIGASFSITWPNPFWAMAMLVDDAECAGGECVVCDMDCDGDVDAFDIEPFLALLFDESLPPCCGTRGSPPFTGDTDGDGDIDAFDIEPFLACLFP